jgi:hypothetical protein
MYLTLSFHSPLRTMKMPRMPQMYAKVQTKEIISTFKTYIWFFGNIGEVEDKKRKDMNKRDEENGKGKGKEKGRQIRYRCHLNPVTLIDLQVDHLDSVN